MVKRVLAIAAFAALCLAGYAAAGGSLKIIKLHRGQSVRIGQVKVIDVTKPLVIRLTTTKTLPAPPAQTVTVTVAAAPPPPPPGPKTSFGDGSYRVNTDIAAGTYTSPGGGSCYWERLSGFSGSLGDIIANGFGDISPIITIASSDVGFHTSSCGIWTKL